MPLHAGRNKCMGKQIQAQVVEQAHLCMGIAVALNLLHDIVQEGALGR